MRTINTMLERYHQGKFNHVWAELVALGPAVRTEPLYPMALAVAHAMMNRARHNIGVLLERLQELNYRFLSRHMNDIWRQPDAERRSMLDAIEQQYGTLPIVLRAWYDIVGEVSLQGAHPNLNHHVGYQRSLALRPEEPFSDPLELEIWDYSICSFYRQATPEARDANPPFAFYFASNVDTKGGYSGSQDYHIMLPATGFDTPIFAYPPWTLKGGGNRNMVSTIFPASGLANLHQIWQTHSTVCVSD
jgi:hypothetical protein